MKNGVIFKGRPWQEDDRECAHCLVCGDLTKDAEEYCYSKPRVKFCVRYHRKTFLNCIVDEDSPFFTVASKMRAGEHVLVVGKYSKRQYETRKGELKDEYYLSVCFLIPQSAITGTAVSMFEDDAPDPMESLNDIDF